MKNALAIALLSSAPATAALAGDGCAGLVSESAIVGVVFTVRDAFLGKCTFSDKSISTKCPLGSRCYVDANLRRIRSGHYHILKVLEVHAITE